MALNIVELPYSYFPDFSRGRPLFNADIYVGNVGTDPEIPVNQKQVTVRQENGSEVQIAQPVKTSAGGVPTYNGSPVTVLVDGAYSIKVLDRFGAEEYYSPDVTKGVPLTPESLPTYTDLYFDNVADMTAANNLSLGQTVRTRGRVSPGDGGGASYIVVADGTYVDGTDGRHEGFDYFQATGYQISLFHNGTVYPEQFGWIGDSTDGTDGTDNTLSINNMIDYCSPFPFNTDLPTSRNLMGKVRAKILGGLGIARVTDSVIINPFIKWEGIKKGAFFGDLGGTIIAADFDSNTKYCADTAPMISGGARPLGATYTGSNFLNGTVIECPGWNIDSVSFVAAQGRKIKGALNRQVAIQSVLTNCGLGCYFGEVYEGVKNSVCYGGRVSDNHMIASAYAVRNENDITIDILENNYLTVSGTKPSTSVYTYISWPNPGLQDFTACIANFAADPHMYSNICEGAQIGLQATGQGFACRDNGNYYEAIDTVIYAIHSIESTLAPSWVFGSSADLINLRGGPSTTARIDLSATSNLTFDSIGFVESGVKGVYIKGASKIASYPIVDGVYIEDWEFNGVKKIYVSSSGDDSKFGITASHPLLTLQEAIARCEPGIENEIVIASGETINTKYSTSSWNVTNARLPKLDVLISGSNSTINVSNDFNEVHCIPLTYGSCRIDGVDLNLSGASATGNYKSFLRTKGNVAYSVVNSSISGSSKAVSGSQAGESGHADLHFRNVTFGNNVQLTDDSGSSRLFSWKEVSNGITDNGLVEGSGASGKIYSRIFP